MGKIMTENSRNFCMVKKRENQVLKLDIRNYLLKISSSSMLCESLELSHIALMDVVNSTLVSQIYVIEQFSFAGGSFVITIH